MHTAGQTLPPQLLSHPRANRDSGQPLTPGPAGPIRSVRVCPSDRAGVLLENPSENDLLCVAGGTSLATAVSTGTGTTTAGGLLVSGRERAAIAIIAAIRLRSASGVPSPVALA